ncbi:MAG TPA: hypothetical protein VMT92_00535 [Steroidobacteraceae bacterium]|nr:hypothetical protein [Steroidobacteraceae bacterium]
MTRVTKLAALAAELDAAGLAARGGFHPGESDRVPPLADGRAVATLVLVGVIGVRQWQAFAASPERADGTPHPLDRWSRRVIRPIAERHGAEALYPFDGPPWHPFQRWAQRAEPVHVSPLGILIHPDWGLWHAYRGALAFAGALDLPPRDRRPSPCHDCRERPCLSRCPVAAITAAGFEARTCRAHLAAPEGAGCVAEGCLARRACPVGTEHRYEAAQAEFHMQAFRRGA